MIDQTQEITPAPEPTLEEYRAQREGRTLPAKVTEPPAAAEPEEDKPEPEPAEASETSDQKQEPEDGEDKPKHKGGFQRRIDKLTREREELRAKLAELEGNPAEKPAGKPAEAPALDKPKVDSFETYDAYVEALADWKVEQKEQARTDREAEAKAKTEQAARVATFQERAGAARTAHEDFDEALEDAPPITTAMREAMLDSEVGPELAYWLAKNPAEVARIAKLSPVSQVREMGKIEVSLTPKSSAPEPKTKVTAAPEPVRPVGTAAQASTKQVSQMDYGEYRAWRESGGGR